MQEPFQDHHMSIPIGGRPISNIRFADDIDLMRATAVNSKSSPTDSMKGQEHMG
ncbi:hypothetical protein DPMN_054248 [Dreissena polymorpha]|uniref:Uncharacterized protein n=1 Tax=Dreissena polymorpha TaxID=45954 RepID=A0A9D4CPA8_DREPO|nr:hypothetical protein DPMN_054248 [Dreissena polymorpha]